MSLEGDKNLKDVPLNPCDRTIDKVEYISNKVMLYGEHPFDIVHAGNTTVLEKIVDRTSCELCGKSRMYYCYTCFTPLPSTRELIPNIDKLPCKIDIIKHPREVDGKSTAGHAKLICPNDVRIFTCPDIPEYSKSSEMVYLMYPGKDAESLEDFLSNFLTDTEKPQTKDAKCLKDNIRIVFIDSTWNQTARILKHQNIKALKKVKIDDRDTVFWRYQTGKSTKHLATIEAIYYFLVDFHTKVLNQPYNSEYDQLLFLYKFMYGKIHELYDRSKLRSYNR